ncbi:hypothetical protein CAOG_05716 [Capsaspora owczarzaki ATCC 30864]|nr:hypothetical protein CAOG_05716 [Capsaspora owczarzaki ATCC 30864]|eukprot:XP_004346389.1 hypothetical protein CAOG_05716 [Capsaspora owczarzaki ATCC 30864]
MQAKFDDFKRSDFVRRCGESKDSAKEALKETLVELKQLKDQLKQDIKPKAAAVAAAILEALKDFGDFTERQFNAIKEAIAEVLERHDDSSASAAAPAESASDEASSSNNDNSASAAVEALAQAPRNDADADSSRTSKNMNNTNEQVAAQGEESLARPDSVYGREATAPPQEMETFYRSRSSVEGVSTVAPALALIAREASAEGVDARIHKWSHELIRLSEIGFDDVDRNIGLLEECNGDLSLVIQRLL